MESYQLPLQQLLLQGVLLGETITRHPTVTQGPRQGKRPLCLCWQKHPTNKTSVNPVLCKEKEVVGDLHGDKSCLLIQVQGTGRPFMSPERKALGEET